jgi:hypothetical protein
VRDPARCYEPITRGELDRLAQIARADREDRFERKPRWRLLYRPRVLAVALCQGAALHYIDGENGVKDFDVWTFYAAHPEAEFPPRWRTVRDFEDPRFGQTVDCPTLMGRRVDLFGRSIDAPPGAEPAEALRRYLSLGRAKSARLLSRKAVVLLDPGPRRGEVIWPVEGRA